jgi:mono/diheme cytochrome c family protein
MFVARVFVVSSLFCLAVAVSLSGQQAQAPTAASTAKASGNVEHGRYLVENVVMCYECHSTRDWPIQIPRIAGLPGYTDEQALRLLTQGAIRFDGKQLRYPMPRFRMSPQDAADVIAYLRTL